MAEHVDISRIQAASSGDRAALEEILLHYYDNVVERLRPKLPADLQGVIAFEDVMQEACADVARSIDKFTAEDGAAFLAWFGRIAENRLIDLARAQRAAKRGGGRQQVQADANVVSSVEDLLTMLAVNERSPSRSMAGHEAVDAVRTALAGIREEYREAIKLRYLEGLSVGEIAEKLDKTKAAVNMLLHRGLGQMRDALGSDSAFFSKKR
ncbi:MAG: sigma-70 family RNA polymerase sigma factor [Phycisphaerales bacterium]|nr:sigma-70 family RNA polymerase sigma factor [Phycisphaerales bacterium]